MGKVSNKLNIEDIRENFIYDSVNAVLIWAKPGLGRRLGAPAGKLKPGGYVQIKFNYLNYYLHRLIYFIETGTWPEIVDHIDGNPGNNHISNLRSSNERFNRMNNPRARSGKLVGAYYKKRDDIWYSNIHINGKVKWLGNFKTEKEAHERYLLELAKLQQF